MHARGGKEKRKKEKRKKEIPNTVTGFKLRLNIQIRGKVRRNCATRFLRDETESSMQQDTYARRYICQAVRKHFHGKMSGDGAEYAGTFPRGRAQPSGDAGAILAAVQL